MPTLRIATRESALALWQAEHVAKLLRQAHPGLEPVLVPMSTRGDQLLDRPLAQIGGKGLFLKELQQALLDGCADIAVHSLKDVPVQPEAGFRIAAISARADPCDALLSPRYGSLEALPVGARVGTSSLRRQCQLRARRPDLVIDDLRGNVDTRLRKLDAGHYDAIVLACAGLERLGLGARIDQRLQPPDWLPAAAQGAIGIERLESRPELDVWLAPVHAAEDAAAVLAERAMSRALEGSCAVPIGALAERLGARLRLHGLVGHADGRLLRDALEGPAEDPEALGQTLAERLLAAGAAAFLGR